jgi:hypothetical protein
LIQICPELMRSVWPWFVFWPNDDAQI